MKQWEVECVELVQANSPPLTLVAVSTARFFQWSARNVRCELYQQKMSAKSCCWWWLMYGGELLYKVSRFPLFFTIHICFSKMMIFTTLLVAAVLRSAAACKYFYNITFKWEALIPCQHAFCSRGLDSLSTTIAVAEVSIPCQPRLL